MNILSQPDYRDSMQAAARAFLERHQAEHLADDGQLFERASQYMVRSLDVPVFMVQRLVHLAMTELNRQPPAYIGIDLAAGPDKTSVVLVDPRTGERACIPRRILPGRILANHTL